MACEIQAPLRYVLVSGDGDFTEVQDDPRVRTVDGFCRTYGILKNDYEYLEVQDRRSCDIVDSWSAG